jgi:hypothetical protein
MGRILWQRGCKENAEPLGEGGTQRLDALILSQDDYFYNTGKQKTPGVFKTLGVNYQSMRSANTRNAHTRNAHHVNPK